MKSVLTIATGKKIYIDMACNLALSFLLWNKDNGIEFYLVTDSASLIPKKVKEKIQIIEIDTNEFDTGFAIKLHLDKFIKTTHTLFIDCDCLVYGNLASVFDKFEGKSVSTIGKNELEGDFFGDILSIRSQFELNYLPKFVGAIYYIKIFQFARKLKPDYDKIGLIRLRKKENEEPLMAIAMAKYLQKSIDDDGSIKADRMFYMHLKSNVINPNAYLWNTSYLPVPDYCTLYSSIPKIIHFNASFTENYEYRAEVTRLYLQYNVIEMKFLNNLIAKVFILIPGIIKQNLINYLRPFYHSLFGIRKIKQTTR
jgi:hypothetical protein